MPPQDRQQQVADMGPLSPGWPLALPERRACIHFFWGCFVPPDYLKFNFQSWYYFHNLAPLASFYVSEGREQERKQTVMERDFFKMQNIKYNI